MSEEKLAAQAAQMNALFSGNEESSGTHGEPTQDPGSLKWAIKTTARTLREPATDDYWLRHLKGERPLGVVPIRADGTVSWGSIDVDRYDMDLTDVILRVDRAKMPLLCCRSKSGGLHLFMFLRDPTPAEDVQSILTEMAASLGLAGSEIFPKQTRLLSERGDMGSWMVMPYFGGDFDGRLHRQVGIKKTGSEMLLNEFISRAQDVTLTPEQVRDLLVKRSRRAAPSRPRNQGDGTTRPPLSETGDFSDGPPCLQHMAAQGFPEGGRNNALFMMGVYFKKASPTNWAQLLEQANAKYMVPPLTADEVALTLRGLEKKDYQYTCRTEPMRSHCDAPVCRGRVHGVGDSHMYPRITGLVKYDVRPDPRWFMNIDHHPDRIELTTQQLVRYTQFQEACVSCVNQIFRSMKQVDWEEVLKPAMDSLEVIKPPEDVHDDTILFEQLEEFLTNRARGETREDLLGERPWLCEPEQRHYFRLRDFQSHLRRIGLKEVKRWEMAQMVEKLRGGSRQLSIKSQNVFVWWVPVDAIQASARLDPPPMQETPI